MRTRSLLAAMLAAGMLLATGRAWGATETVDGIEYAYTVTDGKATLYKGYYSAAIPTSTTGALTMPATLGGYPVTRIGGYAFCNCSGLTSVTIPDSVTSIGKDAFYYCRSLTSVTIPDSVKTIDSEAFKLCKSLTSVTIPDSVTSIGRSAFSDCTSLRSVRLPDPITSIAYETFDGCRALSDVTIPESVTCIEYGAFRFCNSLKGSLVIGNSVTNIGEMAFYDCSSLTSVTIPDSVTSIGEYAFYGCSGLTEFIVGEENEHYSSRNGLLLSKDGSTLIAGINGDVSIPNSVTSIGEYAFYGCSGLTSVTIPNSVTNIGIRAFYYCIRLTSVTIPDAVMTIGEDAFYGCRRVNFFSVGDVNANYSSINGLLLTKDGGTLIAGINGDVAIPTTVTTIANSAFNYKDLSSVSIPSSVTRIGDYAFSRCGNLSRVLFLGDAPSTGTNVFYQTSWCTAGVSRNSAGWGVEIPGRWQGVNIAYYSTAHFDANGGDGAMDNQIVVDGTPTALPPRACSHEMRSSQRIDVPAVVAWLSPVAFGWNDNFHAASGGSVDNLVRVVPPVGKKALRLQPLHDGRARVISGPVPSPSM